MRKFILSAVMMFVLIPFLAKGEEFRLNVGTFDKLQVDDNVNVIFKNNPDSVGYAYFAGEKELSTAYYFENKKGKLKVKLNSEATYRPTKFPTIVVYSEYLSGVENNSDLILTVDADMSVPSLAIKQSGNGMIIFNNFKTNELDASVSMGNGALHLGGSASKANYTITGSGNIEAENVDCKVINCSVLGKGGVIKCNPKQELNVKSAGSAKIYYKGNPAISNKGFGTTTIPLK